MTWLAKTAWTVMEQIEKSKTDKASVSIKSDDQAIHDKKNNNLWKHSSWL